MQMSERLMARQGRVTSRWMQGVPTSSGAKCPFDKLSTRVCNFACPCTMDSAYTVITLHVCDVSRMTEMSVLEENGSGRACYCCVLATYVLHLSVHTPTPQRMNGTWKIAFTCFDAGGNFKISSQMPNTLLPLVSDCFTRCQTFCMRALTRLHLRAPVRSRGALGDVLCIHVEMPLPKTTRWCGERTLASGPS